MIKIREAERWRSDCQGCFRDPGYKKLKIIEISRRVDETSSYGTSICLCQRCRRELHNLLVQDYWDFPLLDLRKGLSDED